MAEITTTATVPAAPESVGTGDPVYDAIASAGESLIEADESEPSDGETGDPAPAAPAISEPVTTDGKPDAETEPEIRGRLSAKRHQEILTRQREKQAAEHQAALKAHEDRLAKLAWAETPEGQAQFILERLEANPDVVSRALAEHPTFSKLLQLRHAQEAAAIEKAGAATPAASKTHPYGDMPGPNIRMPDGQLAYDAEGMKAWGDWVANVSAWNATQQAQAKFEQQLSERLGPIEQKEAAAREQGEAYKRVSGALSFARQHLPKFAELESTIKPYAMKHRDVKTSEAILRGYVEVLWEKVIPELEAKGKVTRDQLRQEVIAELNQKAGAAGERVDSGPTGEASRGSSDPVMDAIRQTARKLTRTEA